MKSWEFPLNCVFVSSASLHQCRLEHVVALCCPLLKCHFLNHLLISLMSVLPSLVRVQQEHTETLQSLRFTLDFARCLIEVAGARGAGLVMEPSLLQQQSLVADQISSLSREWR